MKRGLTGNYERMTVVGSEPVWAFVPTPLPPNPHLQIDEQLREKLDRALIALGRLDTISTVLPDTDLFLYTYVRKEAVLSSQIEGTQSSLSDLLLFEMDEAPGVPLNDVVEVSNYVAAMDYGLRRLHEGFPISNRLFREIHLELLSRGRGNKKSPGEFRRSQNWIGGTRPGNARFVPPAPERVVECMSDLEKFLHNDPAPYPVLIKAAFAHVQFETIHPFLDGNGRLGRLLITLLLCAENVLRKPLLYLSLYLKENREQYYALLQQVRTEGDWEEWVIFFVDGIRQTAEEAVTTAERLVRMFERDRQRIQAIGRVAGSALRLHRALEERPLLTIAKAAQQTGLTTPTVTAAFRALQRAGVVREITGKQRNRVFAYDDYLAILNGATDSAKPPTAAETR